MAKGLAAATEKAMSNAAAIAKGAGLHVENVVSIGEIGETPSASVPAYASPYASLLGLSSSPETDEYADGELVRQSPRAGEGGGEVKHDLLLDTFRRAGISEASEKILPY